jgi:exopolysaccharide biosynthesis polyprenyl glycosylphosphotransferase
MYQRQLARSFSEEFAIQGGYLACKRLMDVSLSSLALILTAPILLAIALCIKISSRGPILFKQTRVGKRGQPFTFYKFRTMYQNADPDLHRRHVKALIRNQSSEGRNMSGAGTPMHKLENDPRITPVGAFLRRTSLDELPQFFNVIRGDMSLVGPRPPLPYEVEEYQEWHLARLAALPGITGLWQVRGRSRVTFDEMVRMDIDYIAHRSLWLDLKILLLTIPAVLVGKGAM